MMKPLMLTIIAMLFATIPAVCQQKMTTDQYVQRYKAIAVEKMRVYGIPASITLAQGILESGNGGSELAVNANNHFGIKCGKSWTGSKIHHDDDAKGECFRKYGTVEESFRDHSIFLKEGKRYASLFELAPTDYRGWATGLKAAGYATNPMYAKMLIDLIDRYKLWQWDQIENLDKALPSKGFSGQGDAPKPMKGTGLTWGYCNGVKYVVARSGDSYPTLARKLGIRLERLLKMNDLSQTMPIEKGQKIFVRNKKGKNAFQHSHIVQQGETTYSISQDFGIKLSALKRKNPALKYSSPIVGQRVML